mmetsp:Transcript_1021/g.2986  ORF Transcript_1021/g.2986 Transcript_1021/m.2986 type:complete len:263 (+) Transcript_1021:647-1435(+)
MGLWQQLSLPLRAVGGRRRLRPSLRFALPRPWPQRQRALQPDRDRHHGVDLVLLVRGLQEPAPGGRVRGARVRPRVAAVRVAGARPGGGCGASGAGAAAVDRRDLSLPAVLHHRRLLLRQLQRERHVRADEGRHLAARRAAGHGCHGEAQAGAAAAAVRRRPVRGGARAHVRADLPSGRLCGAAPRPAVAVRVQGPSGPNPRDGGGGWRRAGHQVAAAGAVPVVGRAHGRAARRPLPVWLAAHAFPRPWHAACAVPECGSRG